MPYTLLSYIENRHTAMASIGLSIIIIAFTRLFRKFQPLLLTFLFGVCLVASQGTAWNQVVSCRMNNAIAETLEEKKASILQSERIVIDQHSFTQKIPYTWVKDPLNQLDQYWGIEGLLGRGFDDMINWVIGKLPPGQIGHPRGFLKDGVFLARSPVQIEGKMFAFDVYDLRTYQFSPQRVPRRGTVLVDYAAVYPNGFYHGKRERP